MNKGEGIWIGIDPGGKGNFGLAILKLDGSAQTCCKGCTDEALQVILRCYGDYTLLGVGVDAPLWWSSGLSSDRKADQWLRRRYGLSGGQVMASNSLRGAALIQGAMFVERIRERFPSVGVTETHPKALWKALMVKNWEDFSKRFSVTWEITSEHERDAVISAVAAREGFEGCWPNDLSVNRHSSEQAPSHFHLAPIHYFWPEA